MYPFIVDYEIYPMRAIYNITVNAKDADEARYIASNLLTAAAKIIDVRSGKPMDIKQLFLMQKGFDARVLEEKNLTWEGTFQLRILAFIDEVAECMKEWRGFKFWSDDRIPRTRVLDGDCVVLDTGEILNQKYVNPLLEEYVDGLHFAISLCIHTGAQVYYPVAILCDDVAEQFLEIYSLAVRLKDKPTSSNADILLSHYLGLGEMLGFKLEEIEHAYIDKNKVNHDRQNNGY
ncbi:dUTP diphosphatase [Bacillus luti]|uniref:dUTP diphosphatase n=1 Tax=Bacillus luti TaxID=2026191 RepID=UPI00289A63A1|nr:dUTP diphosphatase [Bacillus luti]